MPNPDRRDAPVENQPPRAMRVRTALKAGPNRRAHDHLTDHNWQLEIEGVTQGAFTTP
ncbi:MAG: hypothetical protein H6719_15765 [Sandaracinaceae bacterium]|nr:hypothetical protein [Sandaracinaceae bacterium]